jgi:hypothetical protein
MRRVPGVRAARVRLAGALCLVVVSLGGGPPVEAHSSDAAAGVEVEHRDCTGVLVQFRIPERQVRPVVPQEFRLQGPDTRLAVMVSRCDDVAIGGRSTGATTGDVTRAVRCALWGAWCRHIGPRPPDPR